MALGAWGLPGRRAHFFASWSRRSTTRSIRACSGPKALSEQRTMVLRREIVKQRRLDFRPRTHHRQSSHQIQKLNQRVIRRSRKVFNKIDRTVSAATTRSEWRGEIPRAGTALNDCFGDPRCGAAPSVAAAASAFIVILQLHRIPIERLKGRRDPVLAPRAFAAPRMNFQSLNCSAAHISPASQ